LLLYGVIAADEVKKVKKIGTNKQRKAITAREFTMKLKQLRRKRKEDNARRRKK